MEIFSTIILGTPRGISKRILWDTIEGIHRRILWDLGIYAKDNQKISKGFLRTTLTNSFRDPWKNLCIKFRNPVGILEEIIEKASERIFSVEIPGRTNPSVTNPP